MKKNKYFIGTIVLLITICTMGCKHNTNNNYTRTAMTKLPEQMLLKDWQPRSIYNIPATEIKKAKYPVIDMHDHDEAKTPEEVERLIRVMNETGVEKSVIFTNATGARFDSIYALYGKYPDRFMVYCGFDLSEFPNKGWAEKAIKELRRCVKEGAVGVGELHDKGSGLVDGLHPDDPRLNPLYDICAELKLPINLHIADPMWMYEPMDSTNDGLMRSWTWKITDTSGIIGHNGLMKILDNTLRLHPNNLFIIAHLANCTYDLSILGRLFDKYKNFDADISARFAEFSSIPRYAAKFFNKYQDRLVYGTDYLWEVWKPFGPYGQSEPSPEQMFRMTFRVLETEDDHFYLTSLVGYKWPMYGLGLKDEVLKKIYRENALKFIHPK